MSKANTPIGLVVTVRMGDKSSTRILMTMTDKIDEQEASIRRFFAKYEVETLQASLHMVPLFLCDMLDHDFDEPFE